MSKRTIFAWTLPRLSVLALALCASEPLVAGDLVLRNGDVVSGGSAGEMTIKSATYEDVKYRLPGTSRDQSRKASEVVRIRWGSEVTSAYKNAEGAREAGDFADAVKRFTSQASGTGRSRINAQYFLGVTYLAWGLNDSSKYTDAVTAFRAYLAENESKKDFYVPHATLALANALTAAGKFSEAESELTKLTGGKMGPTWVVGAKLGLAEVKLAQDDFSGARQLFGELRTNGAVIGDSEFKGKALLGYAKSQLGQKQYGPAIKTVKEELLAQGGRTPERMDRFAASGFLVWGQAEQAQAGSDKKKLQWALIRYIRAAAIAPQHTEDLAEALYRQNDVLKKLGEQGRAEETRQRLLKECPNSPWAKK